MNTGDLWGVYTLLLLVLFVGIVVWAWSGKRARAFKEAAEIPLLDDKPEKKNGPPLSKEARHD
jgi:cbb3-type cytochrome oxidase subunit 3